MQDKADSSWVGKDFRRVDLRHADLTNKVLFGADLREAQLYGAKISLVCQTFDGVKLDAHQVAMLLLMISQADINPQIQRAIRATAQETVGDNDYYVLQRMLRVV